MEHSCWSWRRLVLPLLILLFSFVYSDAYAVKHAGWRIAGNRVFSQQQLMNLCLGAKSVHESARRIAAFYHQQGYTLAGAMVVKNSVRVYEGYIDRVRVVSPPGRLKVLLVAYGNKIVEERPFRIQTVDRIKALFHHGTGIKMRSVVVEPRRQIGTGELDIIV